MGFWHTGYMEFHETTGGFSDFWIPPPEVFPCGTCGVTFRSDSDLRVHLFQGHSIRRPILVFGGRECGRSRLTITSATTPSDWAVSDADEVAVNGSAASAAGLPELLSCQREGVVDVVLSNDQLVQDFQFEFALSEEEDLAGVDAALSRLIDSAELSLRSVDDFIMRSKYYPTAGRYLGRTGELPLRRSCARGPCRGRRCCIERLRGEVRPSRRHPQQLRQAASGSGVWHRGFPLQPVRPRHVTDP